MKRLFNQEISDIKSVTLINQGDDQVTSLHSDWSRFKSNIVHLSQELNAVNDNWLGTDFWARRGLKHGSQWSPASVCGEMKLNWTCQAADYHLWCFTPIWTSSTHRTTLSSQHQQKQTRTVAAVSIKVSFLQSCVRHLCLSQKHPGYLWDPNWWLQSQKSAKWHETVWHTAGQQLQLCKMDECSSMFIHPLNQWCSNGSRDKFLLKLSKRMS